MSYTTGMLCGSMAYQLLQGLLIGKFLPVILVEFRRIIAKPWGALRDLILFTLVLFLIGTLPWIDNWAHIFGFIFGLLISLGTCHTYSSCVCIYGPSHAKWRTFFP